MRIALLGPLALTDAGGNPVEVAGLRLRTLLARLAVDNGQPVARDALIEAVWPGGASLNALQTLVARLRRIVPDVESTPNGYRLRPGSTTVDIAEFEQLVAAGRVNEALEHWRGEPFADLEAPSFTLAVRARLIDVRVRAAEALFERALTAGRPVGGLAQRVAEQVAEQVAELVAEYPTREPLRALQLRALAAAGRPADALLAYEDLRQHLADELGADPSPAVQAVHTAILQGRAGPAAAAVRAPLTSFVGREDELAQVAAALGRSRLVTLAGPGGAGKTRLAQELAQTRLEQAYMVELAPVREPVEVAATALATVGVATTNLTPGSAAAATARIVSALRDQAALLILDNCEHLLDACAALVEAVLDGCPRVRILCTTREPLAIDGEILCPVGPLPLPASSVDTAAAAANPAVRLFLDRASAVRPGFALDRENLGAVVEICRRLDGLPLAIELACARLRTLAVEEIAARLGDRFRLLTGGSRTALPRHQTLAAVVGWSWDLFDAREQVLARRLAVFAGGAEIAAIEAVCSGSGLAHDDVLTVLFGLVEKSFVRLRPVVDGPSRYDMLDTILAFAATELAAAGESDAVRRTQALHGLAQAEQAEPALRGRDQLSWLAWYRREYDNLVSGLRWAVDAGEAEIAVRMVVALGWFWVLRSSAEGASWVREVLAMPGLTAVAPTTLATAYAYDAMNSFGSGELDRAAASAKAAALDEAGSHPTTAIVGAVVRAEPGLPAIMAELGRLADHPDQWTAAAGHLIRGHAAETAGDLAAGREHLLAAHQRFVAAGDRWGTTMVLSGLANNDSIAGEWESAIDRLTEAIQLAGEVGAEDDRAWMLARRGWERVRAGQTALDDLLAAAQEGRDRGRAVVAAIADIYLAEAARYSGDLDRARSLLTDAMDGLAGVEGTMPPRLRVLAQLGLALSTGDGDDLTPARHAVDEALAIGDHPLLSTVADGLGELLADRDPVAAGRFLDLAITLRGALDAGSPTVRAARTRVRSRGIPLADAPTQPAAGAAAQLAELAHDALR